MSSGRCEWRLLTNLTEGREVQQSDSTHLDRYLGGGGPGAKEEAKVTNMRTYLRIECYKIETILG